MRWGLMSFNNACCGCKPSTTARPPQNGSTYRRSEFFSQIGSRYETSQRFPPAHFNGGLNIARDSPQQRACVDLRETQRSVGVVERMQPRGERDGLPVRQGGDEDRAQG